MSGELKPCVGKGCSNVGAPEKGLDYFFCAACGDELERCLNAEAAKHSPGPIRAGIAEGKLASDPAMQTEVEVDNNKPLTGLWRKNPETPEGKYLVKRRDGTIPDWPNFVLGAKDPAAPAALRAYADAAETLGMNPLYVQQVRDLASEFELYRIRQGSGDPDRGRHRKDDPATVAEMRKGRSS